MQTWGRKVRTHAILSATRRHALAGQGRIFWSGLSTPHQEQRSQRNSKTFCWTPQPKKPTLSLIPLFHAPTRRKLLRDDRVNSLPMAENGGKAGPEPGDRVAIGITFGNSNSSIAYTVDDKAEVIANEDGGEFSVDRWIYS